MMSQSNEKIVIDCLHGSFHDGSVWKYMVPPLEEHFEVWTPTLDFKDLSKTKDDFAQERAAALSSRAGIILVGWSFGAPIQERTATLLSEGQVKGVVLLNASVEIPLDHDLSRPLPPKRANDYETAAVYVKNGLRTVRRSKYVDYFCQDLRDSGRHADIAWLTTTLRDQSDTIDNASAIESKANVPTLVIYAEDDRVISPQHTQATAQANGFEAQSVPGGHASPVSQSDLIAAKIIAFADKLRLSDDDFVQSPASG